MRVGNIKVKNFYEKHLGSDKWIEVYPESLKDMRLIESLATKGDDPEAPEGAVTYRNTSPGETGQSPILVRYSVAHHAGIIDMTKKRKKA